MVWRQEKVLRTNLVKNPDFRAYKGTTVVRTNICANPQGAIDTTGWSNYTNSGAASISRVTPTTTPKTSSNATCIRSTWSDVSSGGGLFYTTSAGSVTAGYPFALSASVRSNKALTWYAQIKFYNSSNAQVGTTTNGTSLSFGADGWNSISVLATAPSGSSYAVVGFYTSSGLSANTWMDVAEVLFETSQIVDTFFDGSVPLPASSGLTVSWTGEAGKSTSQAKGNNINTANWIVWGTSTVYQYPNTGCILRPGANGSGGLFSESSVPTITLETPYTTSFLLESTNISSVSITCSIEFWSTSKIKSKSLTITTPVSQRVVLTETAPVGTTSVRVVVAYPSNVAGLTIAISSVLLEQTSTDNSYFDGSFPSSADMSFRWNGAVSTASSDMYIPALISPPAGLWSATSFGLVESLIVDGVDIQSMAFGVESVDSVPPTLKGNHLTIPGRNGVVAQFNRSYDPGSLALKMWVLGCETDGTVPGLRSSRRQLFERNLRALMRLFGYQGNTVTLTKTIFGDGPGSNPIQVKALAIIDGFSSLETMAARQRAEMTVALTLVDSFWSDVNTTTDATTPSATMPQTLRLTDPGTAPVDDSIISITGPISNPRVTCPASGSWVQYTGTVPSGQTLVIDTGAATAKIGNNSVLSLVTHGGTARFMVIPPRNSGSMTDTGFQTTLSLTGTGTGSTTKFSVQYNRKHLVVV